MTVLLLLFLLLLMLLLFLLLLLMLLLLLLFNSISFSNRHGESEYNVQERIGGDPDLTVRGHRYAKALGQYINALGEGGIYICTTASGLKFETHFTLF